MPFFSCYLFVRMQGSHDFPQVRWTPGLRRIVMFGGRPAVVPDEVMDLIKERLAGENHPWVTLSTAEASQFEARAQTAL